MIELLVITGCIGALIALVSVYLGFYIAKQGYTYSVPALGNLGVTEGDPTTVTEYDPDWTDEMYDNLGNLGEEPKEEDPVHQTVERFMKEHGVNPEDALGPTEVPSQPFVGDEVQEVEDDR